MKSEGFRVERSSRTYKRVLIHERMNKHMLYTSRFRCVGSSVPSKEATCCKHCKRGGELRAHRAIAPSILHRWVFGSLGFLGSVISGFLLSLGFWVSGDWVNGSPAVSSSTSIMMQLENRSPYSI